MKFDGELLVKTLKTKKMKTEKNAAEAEEMPLFIEVEDGNGTIHKIANANNPKVCPQSGVFTIEAIRRNKFKQPRASFTRVTDRNTGIIYGITNGVDDKTKTLRFERIVLLDMMQFDCSVQKDKELWCVVSRYEHMEGSPLAHGAKPLYRKHDKEADANKIIKLSKDKRRAAQIAEDLTGAELYDMANSLGLSSEHNSMAVLLAEVIKKAETDPTGFLAIYENANREIITVFHRCKTVGLIDLDIQQGYMWKKSYPLGMSEAAAIKTICDNPALLQTMDMESKERSSAFKSFATKEEMKTIVPKNSVEKSPTKPEEFLTNRDIDAKIAKLEELEKKAIANNKVQEELNKRLEAHLASLSKTEVDVNPALTELEEDIPNAPKKANKK